MIINASTYAKGLALSKNKRPMFGYSHEEREANEYALDSTLNMRNTVKTHRPNDGDKPEHLKKLDDEIIGHAFDLADTYQDELDQTGTIAEIA